MVVVRTRRMMWYWLKFNDFYGRLPNPTVLCKRRNNGFRSTLCHYLDNCNEENNAPETEGSTGSLRHVRQEFYSTNLRWPGKRTRGPDFNGVCRHRAPSSSVQAQLSGRTARNTSMERNVFESSQEASNDTLDRERTIQWCD